MQRVVYLLCAVAGLHFSQAAAPLDEEYFAPTTRVTGLTYPNPPNCTCQVVMGVHQTSSTGPDQAQPTTSPVPSAVDGTVTLQIENLADFAYEDGFELVVNMPLDAIIASATNASMGSPGAGVNNTAAYSLVSQLELPALGTESQFINLTIMAGSQDFTPRSIFLNASRCALALEGYFAASLPEGQYNLSQIISKIPPLPSNP